MIRDDDQAIRPEPVVTARALSLAAVPAVPVSVPRSQATHDADVIVRWVEAARKGDREAFGELYRRYVPMVHGILLARVPRPDVSDLVQDVFLQALKRLDSLRDARTFGGWLATIARNRAIDFHRRTPAAVELPENLAAPEGRHAEALAVLAMIRGLPDAYRETLVLRLVEGMTGPEIAAHTGLTPGSVRVNLHRGMSLLRRKLNLPEGSGEES